jgi:hypothetical protein
MSVDKKISELLDLPSAPLATDKLPIVRGGETYRIDYSTFTATSPTPGACTLEQFGAVGDNATDDAAALNAALAAIAAGTYRALVLGAKTYYVPGLHTVPTGCIIQGQGDASVLRTTTDTTTLRCAVDALDITLRDFQMLGSSAGTSQHAVEVGRDGIAGTGVSRFRAINLTIRNFGGYGLAFSRGPQSNADLYYGPQINNCRIRACAKGIVCTQGAEYGKVTNTDIRDCTEQGVWVGAGNWSYTGCNITANAANVRLVAGTNDTHGQFVSCNINHPSGAFNIVVDAGITQGHTFVGCHIYEGDWSIGASTCVLNFVGCIVDPENVANAGAVRLVNCLFPGDYFVSWTESGNGWTEILSPLDAQGGPLPSWLRDRMQRPFTFSANANQTLTWQEAVAGTLIVNDGVTTASRQLTSPWGPDSGRQQRVINNNVFPITFRWASGTAITVGPGQTALFGGNGANAIRLDGRVDASALAIPALDIDWSAASIFTKTLSAGANVITFSNTADGTIIVVLTGAASTVTWPTVKWSGGISPTQTASGTDVYTFVKAGASIYGSVLQVMA